MSLTPEQIALLLKEEEERPTTGSRGPRKSKVDPTQDRSLTQWQKLNHHICSRTCEHRSNSDNPTIQKDAEGNVTQIGNSCWNPNCEDNKRNKETDRGTQIVAEVKGQFICRYCYLAGYLV